jgi:hypothetical protein
MITALLAAALIQTAPAPVDCTDADHQAFAFWVGDWDVSPTGTEAVVARSVISTAAGGCAIEENYHQTLGPGGVAADYRGASFSIFDSAGGGVWRQFYVDNGGGVTAFEGKVVDGAMVLDAPGDRPNIKQRMTLQVQPDGSVRQWGMVSRDGGQTWTATGGYDFTYRRRP